jgi:uncharacterized delta-60 repeat protein
LLSNFENKKRQNKMQFNLCVKIYFFTLTQVKQILNKNSMKLIYTLFLLITSTIAFSQIVELDATFGNNGKVHTGFGTSQNKASAVAVQPDGKIIVGGSAYSANTNNSWQNDTENSVLVRYNTDGSLDSTFGYNGLVMNDIYQFYNAEDCQTSVYSIIILPNGKFLTYGKAQINYGQLTLLVQYNSNGSIDTSFGNNGQVTSNSFPVEGATSLIIQPDNKIVALGVEYLQPSPGVYISKFVVERFNDDGSIDSTFAAVGRVVTEFAFGYNTPLSIALQADGKIVAVGSTPNNRFAIARYTTNGLLDNTFDTDGKVTTSFGVGTNSYAKFVSVDSNGKIMLVGRMHNTTSNIYSAVFARYNTNGSLDISFDGDGLATNPISATDSSVNFISALEQTDGKFIVITSADPQGSYYFATNFVTRRYNADGTADLSFGVNGKVITTIQPGFNNAKNIAMQSDGKILVVGHSRPLELIYNTAPNEFNVIRYNSNGTLDTTFDYDGKAKTNFESSNDECTILLTQPDGKHIAIGTKIYLEPNNTFHKDIALARYTNEGSLDSTFGNSGKVVSVFGQNVNIINNAVLQPDGKIVIANTTSYFGAPTNSYELIRYNSNGSLDSTYGINGKVVTEFETKSLLTQADGKIIAISISFDTLNNIFLTLKRYTNTGQLDNTFDNDGSISMMGNYNLPFTSIIQPDGKIIVSTNAIDSLGQIGTSLTRFNTDGSIDTTFVNTFTSINLVFSPKSMFIQSDGKIIVAGLSQVFNGFDVYLFCTVRYNIDGSMDTTYGTNGILSSYIGNYWTPYRIIQSIILQPDGKFVVALGKHEFFPATPTPNTYDIVIVRFDTNGNYDNTFGTGGTFTSAFYNKYDEAFAMNLQSDNKIVVAGTTDIGINRDFALIRLNNNIDPCLFGATSNTISLFACDSINLNGQTYTASGNYSQTLVNAAGCDSLLSINLNLNINTSNSISPVACNYYTLNNQTYSSSGTYAQTLVNAAGCDSLLTINLTINAVDDSVVVGNASFMANSASGTYQWLDCDNGNSIIVGATNQIFTPSGNGNFAVIITDNSCIDTSNCYSMMTVGITSLENNFSVNIYPNPTTEALVIEVSDLIETKSYKLMDNIGRQLLFGSLNKKKTTVELIGLSGGIYYLQILDNLGQQKTIKVVRE